MAGNDDLSPLSDGPDLGAFGEMDDEDDGPFGGAPAPAPMPEPPPVRVAQAPTGTMTDAEPRLDEFYRVAQARRQEDDTLQRLLDATGGPLQQPTQAEPQAQPETQTQPAAGVDQSTRNFAAGEQAWGQRLEGLWSFVHSALEARRQANAESGTVDRDGALVEWLASHAQRNVGDAQRRQQEASQIAAGLRAGPRSSYARNLVNSAGRGAVEGVVANTLYAMGYTWQIIKQQPLTEAEENGVYQVGAAIAEQAQRQFPNDPARQHEFSAVVAEGAGSMLGFLGPGLVTQIMTRAGPRASAWIYGLWSGGLGAASTTGQLTNEAREAAERGDTFSDGRPVTEADVRRVFAMAPGIGATEAAPIVRLLNRTGGTPALRIVLQMMEEGGQEFGQEILSNLVARSNFDEARRIDEGAWQGLAVGSMLGGAMGGGRELSVRRDNLIQEARLGGVRTRTDAGGLPQEGTAPPLAGAEILPPPIPGQDVTTGDVTREMAQPSALQQMLSRPDGDPLVSRIERQLPPQADFGVPDHTLARWMFQNLERGEWQAPADTTPPARQPSNLNQIGDVLEGRLPQDGPPANLDMIRLQEDEQVLVMQALLTRTRYFNMLADEISRTGSARSSAGVLDLMSAEKAYKEATAAEAELRRRLGSRPVNALLADVMEQIKGGDANARVSYDQILAYVQSRFGMGGGNVQSAPARLSFQKGGPEEKFILANYDKMGVYEMAERLGYSRRVVEREMRPILERNGITPRAKGGQLPAQNAERDAAIEAMYREGRPLDQIGRRHGLSREGVAGVIRGLREAGADIPHRYGARYSNPEELIEQVLDLNAQGKTRDEIASELGITRSKASGIIARAMDEDVPTSSAQDAPQHIMRAVGGADPTLSAHWEKLSKKDRTNIAADAQVMPQHSVGERVARKVEEVVVPKGETVRHADETLRSIERVAEPYMGLVPKDTDVGLLQEIKPIGGGYVRLTFKVISGPSKSAVRVMKWEDAQASRAFFDNGVRDGVRRHPPLIWIARRYAPRDDTASDAVLENFHHSLGGELAHELGHRLFPVIGEVLKRRLLGHAERLHVLDTPLSDYFVRVGREDMIEPGIEGYTLGDYYKISYHDRPNKAALIEEEGVMLMVEMSHHRGVYTDEQIASIKPDIEAFIASALPSRAPPSGDLPFQRQEAAGADVIAQTQEGKGADTQAAAGGNLPERLARVPTYEEALERLASPRQADQRVLEGEIIEPLERRVARAKESKHWPQSWFEGPWGVHKPHLPTPENLEDAIRHVRLIEAEAAWEAVAFPQGRLMGDERKAAEAAAYKAQPQVWEELRAAKIAFKEGRKKAPLSPGDLMWHGLDRTPGEAEPTPSDLLDVVAREKFFVAGHPALGSGRRQAAERLLEQKIQSLNKSSWGELTAEEKIELVQATGRADEPGGAVIGPEEQGASDTSPSARKARAEAMGFDTVVYHGTGDPNFDAFDPSRSRWDEGASWFSDDRGVANRFAHTWSGAAVIPVRLRTEGFAEIDWPTWFKQHTGEEFNPYVHDSILEQADLVEEYKAKGVPGIIVRRATEDVGPRAAPVEHTAYAVFDPSNIRSINASFDPREDGSADLMAAAGGGMPPLPPGGQPPAPPAGAQPPARPNVSREFDFNWGAIESQDHVKAMAGQMMDTFRDELVARGVSGGGRGHVQSWKQTADKAGMLNAVEMLFDEGRSKGMTYDAAGMEAMGNLYVSSMDNLKAMVEKAAGDTATPEDYIALRHMMSVHRMVQQEFWGGVSEAGRTLNILKKVKGASQEYSRGLEDIIQQTGGLDTNKALAKALAGYIGEGDFAGADKFIEKSKTAKTLEAVLEAWKGGLLTGLTTQIVNATSNASILPLSVIERAAAGMVGSVLHPVDGVRLSEATAMAAGMKMAMREAVMAAGRSFRSGQQEWGTNQVEGGQGYVPRTSAEAVGLPVPSTMTARGASGDLSRFGALGEAQTYREFAQQPKTMLGLGMDMLSTVATTGFRMLGASDAFFKTLNQGAEFMAQAVRRADQQLMRGEITQDAFRERAFELYQRMTDPSDTDPDIVSMRMAARDFAEYNTFTNEPGDITKLLEKARQWNNPVGKAIGHAIIPFTRTPGNLMTYALVDRSPIGLLTKRFWREVNAGGARADLALARMGLGTIVLGVFIDLALDGHITGDGPEDWRMRQAWMRGGWQPNSVRIPRGTNADGTPKYTFVQINRLDPVASIPLLGAELADLFTGRNQAPDQPWSEAYWAAAFVVTERAMQKPTLMGVANFLKAVLNPDRHAEYWGQRMTGSVVPTIVAHGAAAQDPLLRNTDAEQWLTRQINALKARTPGLSASLPPRLDFWGREITRESGMGATYDFISPFRVRSNEQAEPIDREMGRLNFYPSHPPNLSVMRTEAAQRALEGHRRSRGARGTGVIEGLLARDPETPSGESNSVPLRGLPVARNRLITLTSATPASKLVRDNEEALVAGSASGAILRLAEFGDKNLRETLNDMVTNNEQYQQLPDDRRTEAIKLIIQDFRTAARAQVIREFPELRQRRDQMRTRLEGAQPVPF
jgi:DNA-binding CsgD family transcriptional regulator